MKMYVDPGINIDAVKAQGTKIETKAFGMLTDFEAGCWANILGHSRKEIVGLIAEKSTNVFHFHHFFKTEHPEALIRAIVNAADLPQDYDGTFISSGSEAVSLSVMLAEVITGRKKKLSFNCSYLSSSADLRMPRDENTWLDLDITECLSCKGSCEGCSRMRGIDFNEFAAFVFEPGNSGGIVQLPPQQLISYITKKIKGANGLIITNEVTTGFGRTGKWFGFQHYQAFSCDLELPDIIAMGKGMGNGYPISGILIKRHFLASISDKKFYYVQSHIDDPIGCMVSRKVVELMVEENIVQKSAELGDYFQEKLKNIKNKTQAIKEVRGRGLMIACELTDAFNVKEIFIALLNLGFFVGFSEVKRVLRFYPPLTISKKEIDDLCIMLGTIMSQKPRL